MSSPPHHQPSLVGLSFDDGPDPRWTGEVARALDRLRVRATFFVCTARLGQTGSRTLRDLRAAGHEIGLHGHGHLDHAGTPAPRVRSDTERALAVLARLGLRPRLWRTPWGRVGPVTFELAARHRLALVGWDVDTHDWAGDPWRAMLASCSPALGPGSIVLLHDSAGPGARRRGCGQTVALLGPLVAAIRGIGCQPTTVGDLAAGAR